MVERHVKWKLELTGKSGFFSDEAESEMFEGLRVCVPTREERA